LQLKKISAGFLVWNVANIIWIVLAIVSRNWPQVLMFSVYMVVNAWGFTSWGKARVGTKTES